MFSRFLALFVLVGTTFAQTATPPTAATVEVWPEGKMPGNGAKEPEAEVPRKDGFHRITNVSRPSLTLFPASQKEGAAAAPAMIVCPGGGYGYTVIDKEGTEIAARLNSAWISALMLKKDSSPNRSRTGEMESGGGIGRLGGSDSGRVLAVGRRGSAKI